MHNKMNRSLVIAAIVAVTSATKLRQIEKTSANQDTYKVNCGTIKADDCKKDVEDKSKVNGGQPSADCTETTMEINPSKSAG